MSTTQDSLSILSLDFSDPALTPKIVGRFLETATLDEASADAREFYRRGSNRFTEHVPFALSYTTTHLSAGITDEALSGILRLRDNGLSMAKILMRLLDRNISANAILLLRDVAIRQGVVDVLQPMFNYLLTDNFTRLVGADGKISAATLERLEGLASYDQGLAIARLVSAGQLDAAMAMLIDTPMGNMQVNFENVHVISSFLAKHLAKLIESGWLETLCEHVLRQDMDAIVANQDSCILLGSLLHIGGYSAGVALLNKGCATDGEVMALRDRSIAEWLLDRRGMTSPAEGIFEWERSVLLEEGERRYPIRGFTKPQLLACMPDARLFKTLVITDDSVILRDSTFNPFDAATNFIVQTPDHHSMLAYLPKRTSYITGDVILIGEHWNFWHYLVNHIGKAAFAFGKEEYKDFKLLFFHEPSEGNLQLLERLGLSRDNVIVDNDFSHVFERLWVASIPYSETWMEQGSYTRRTTVSDDTILAIREAAQGGVPTLGARKIYLTRRDAIHRRLENEAEVCDFLRGYGFEIAEMSTLTVDQQCELVRDARMIIGVYGAQLTSAFFAPPGCHVVEFAFERLLNHIHYEMPSKMLGLDYTKICCDTIGPAGPSGIHAHPSLLVPLDVLKIAVERVIGPK